YWCIKEYSVRTNDSVSIRTLSKRYEYAEGRDRFPLLRGSKTKQHGYHPDGKEWFITESESTCDFRHSEGEFDDRDFTLTTYGLPEPYGITWSRPTPRYVWLLIGAVGCLMLGLGLRYLAKRKKTASIGSSGGSQ